MRTTGNYKHGGHGTRLYNIWKGMRQRCNDPNHSRHKNYHDKGIKVCSEWDSFVLFRAWAMKNGYKDNLSIDRINHDGNYEPNNCRWVDMKVQQNNRSNNRIVEYNGEKHTLTEWAEITGVGYYTLRARLYVRHWSVERTLTE